jgi:H+-transporting ATPase
MSDTLSSKPKSDPSFGSRSEADDSKKCEALMPASPTIAATANAPDNVSKTGLTSDAARRQLAKFGPNAMPDIGVHPLAMAIEKFWAPVPWMLEAAIVLELLLGKWLEAAIIALLVVFNAALGLLQEGRAQATLAALKSRLALTASVKREGAWKTVPATDLPPGDLVKLSLGGVVAADVKLTGGSNAFSPLDSARS